jgi:hypothetical protein
MAPNHIKESTDIHIYLDLDPRTPGIPGGQGPVRQEPRGVNKYTHVCGGQGPRTPGTPGGSTNIDIYLGPRGPVRPRTPGSLSTKHTHLSGARGGPYALDPGGVSKYTHLSGARGPRTPGTPGCQPIYTPNRKIRNGICWVSEGNLAEILGVRFEVWPAPGACVAPLVTRLRDIRSAKRLCKEGPKQHEYEQYKKLSKTFGGLGGSGGPTFGGLGVSGGVVPDVKKPKYLNQAGLVARSPAPGPEALLRNLKSKGSRSGCLAKWFVGGLGYQSQKTTKSKGA